MEKKVYGPHGSKVTKPDLSKYRKLVANEDLQIGDLIFIANTFSRNYYEVVRLTKTTAIIMYNETGKGIFRKAVDFTGEPIYKPKIKWNINERIAYRKINP